MMRAGKFFGMRKDGGKFQPLLPLPRNEKELSDLGERSDRSDCEFDSEDLASSGEERSEINNSRRNIDDDSFYAWMKKFLYLTENYDIKQLQRAYSHELYEMNPNPFKDSEDQTKSEEGAYTLLSIYSYLDQNGLDDTKLMNNIAIPKLSGGDVDTFLKESDIFLRDRSVFLLDSLSGSPSSMLHSKMESEVNEEYDLFVSRAPERSFSLEYKVRFFKTLLYYVLDKCQTEGIDAFKHNKNLYSDLGTKCLGFEAHFEICMMLISAYATNLLALDNSEYFVLRALKKYQIRKNYTSQELLQVRVFAQLLSFRVYLNDVIKKSELEEKNTTEKECKEKEDKTEIVRIKKFEKEALDLIAYNLFDSHMYDTNASVREVLEFGKRSLQIRDPNLQWRAFDNLGLYAVNNGQRQLAYDIYYSWLNSHAVGKIADYLPEDVEFGDKLFQRVADSEWYAACSSDIRGNFAYVCADIADTYDQGTKEYIMFRNIAETEIKTAVNESILDGDAHYIYGTLLSEHAEVETDLDRKCNLYQKAVREYERCYIIREKNKKFEALWRIFITFQRAFFSCVVDKMCFLDQSDSPEMHFEASDIMEQFCSNEYYARIMELFTDKYSDELRKGFLNGKPNEKYSAFYVTWMLEQYRMRWKDRCKFAEGDKCDVWLNEIESLLLLLDEATVSLRRNLRRRDYSTVHYYTRDKDKDKDIASDKKKASPIEYYTTLNTARYLFDEMQKKSDGSITVLADGKRGKNCLTAMNARYMNDPCEGLTLMKVLMKDSGGRQDSLFPIKSAEKIRDEIFRDHYIFLKSFTNLNDNLIMWNRYASDFDSEGRSCNGCLISLDIDEFGGAIYDNETRKSLNRLEMNEAYDEYYLYRVVYLSPEDKIKEGRNPDLNVDTDPQLFNKVNRKYEFLKMLIPMLDTTLAKIPPVFEEKEEKEAFLREIRDYVRQSLSLIIFLFKGDEYADERESRIVFSRRPDQQDTIRVLPGTPAKLCVNPYFQIYVKSIMFGPNVRDEESWIPYLQYQLNRMWAKNPAVGEESGKKPQDMYTIEKSAIHYHT